MISAHPDLDAVFSTSDSQSIGAVKALKAAGKDPLFVSFDAQPAVVEDDPERRRDRRVGRAGRRARSAPTRSRPRSPPRAASRSSKQTLVPVTVVDETTRPTGRAERCPCPATSRARRGRGDRGRGFGRARADAVARDGRHLPPPAAGGGGHRPGRPARARRARRRSGSSRAGPTSSTSSRASPRAPASGRARAAGRSTRAPSCSAAPAASARSIGAARARGVRSRRPGTGIPTSPPPRCLDRRSQRRRRWFTTVTEAGMLGKIGLQRARRSRAG